MTLAGRKHKDNVMMTESILETENREVTELSFAELDEVSGGHRGSDVFTWGLIGGLAAVVLVAIIL